LLEPSKQLREAEANGNLTARLALLEEAKSLPWGAGLGRVLAPPQRACRRAAWLPEAESYVEKTLRARG
jgi:L-rhamnose isomerase